MPGKTVNGISKTTLVQNLSQVSCSPKMAGTDSLYSPEVLDSDCKKFSNK